MRSVELLELSDPAFTPNHLRFATVYSPALNGRFDMTICLPGAVGTDGPVIILLHGVRGSHWSWAYQGGVVALCERLRTDDNFANFTVVMPSDGLAGLGSGYINRKSGRFGDYIVHDLPEALSQLKIGLSARSNTYIAGLSMGGYGALRLGLKHADRFKGISAHSAVPTFEALKTFTGPDIEADLIETDTDILKLAKACEYRPPLRFDCGLDDSLLDGNRVLSENLLRLGYNHEFSLFDGGHDWAYWQTHIAKSSSFFAGLERKSASTKPERSV